MTTIGQTNGIGLDASRLKSKENLAKAGRQFEAVFTGMMLKSMRAAKLADPLFESKALDTFRDMADQKVVATMADAMPLGIGRAMTEFLGRSQADLAAADPAAPSPAAHPAATTPVQPDLKTPAG